MDVDDEPRLAPVFIAANVSEVDFAEKLLESEGIDYEVTLEAYARALLGGVCLQGVMFQVREGQAAYCRRLFTERGLARGVIE